VTNLTLSRRYAKALLAIGQEDGRLEQYGRELADFSAALDQIPDLLQAVTNPVYPAGSRRGVLEAVLAKTDYSPVTRNFLLLLHDKRRLAFLASIMAIYSHLVDEVSGVVRAKVTTASSISAELQERIKATLEKLTGKKIVMQLQDDPEIIGGLVAQVGDLILDGSVKTQLQSLRDTLKGVG